MSDDFVEALEQELRRVHARRSRPPAPAPRLTAALVAVAVACGVVVSTLSRPPAERTAPSVRPLSRQQFPISILGRAPTSADSPLQDSAVVRLLQRRFAGPARPILATFRVARTYDGEQIAVATNAREQSCLFLLDATEPNAGGCIPPPTGRGSTGETVRTTSLRIGLVHDGIPAVAVVGPDGVARRCRVVNNVYAVPAADAAYATWTDHGTTVREPLDDGLRLHAVGGRGLAYVLIADQLALTLPAAPELRSGEHLAMWVRGPQGARRLAGAQPIPQTGQPAFRRPRRLGTYRRVAVTADTRTDRIGRVLWQGALPRG